jgi:hypothetical protein
MNMHVISPANLLNLLSTPALVTVLAFLPSGVLRAAEPAVPETPKDVVLIQPARPLRLTDEAITKAVRETLAENPEKKSVRDGGPLRADRYERFGRRVDDSIVPGCLQPDGLKFQPPHIGPVVLRDLFALPFLAMAAIRGKCR